MPRNRSVQLGLRSTDFDLFGHLNQAVYHELFEEARVSLLREIWETADPQFVLVRTELDYRSEIPYGAVEVEIELWPEEVGRSSFVIGSTMREDGKVAAEGRFVLVAWDGRRRASRPLEAAERESLAALIAEPDRG